MYDILCANTKTYTHAHKFNLHTYIYTYTYTSIHVGVGFVACILGPLMYDTSRIYDTRIHTHMCICICTYIYIYAITGGLRSMTTGASHVWHTRYVQYTRTHTYINIYAYTGGGEPRSVTTGACHVWHIQYIQYTHTHTHIYIYIYMHVQVEVSFVATLLWPVMHDTPGIYNTRTHTRIYIYIHIKVEVSFVASLVGPLMYDTSCAPSLDWTSIPVCAHPASVSLLLRHLAPHCTTLHHTAPHCITLHHSVTHWHTLRAIAVDRPCLYVSPWLSRQGDWGTYRNATHCNALQRTATHCNALQRTATHCNALQRTPQYRDVPCLLEEKTISTFFWVPGTQAQRLNGGVCMCVCVCVCVCRCLVFVCFWFPCAIHEPLTLPSLYCCNTLENTATCCTTLRSRHCNALQHTATGGQSMSGDSAQDKLVAPACHATSWCAARFGGVWWRAVCGTQEVRRHDALGFVARVARVWTTHGAPRARVARWSWAAGCARGGTVVVACAL